MRTKDRNNEYARLPSGEEASHIWAEDVEGAPTYQVEEIQEALDCLVESGHIEQKRDANGDQVFRRNRQGVLEPVWVTTGKPFVDDPLEIDSANEKVQLP